MQIDTKTEPYYTNGNDDFGANMTKECVSHSSKLIELYRCLEYPYGILVSGVAMTILFATLYPVIWTDDPFSWWGKCIFLIGIWCLVVITVLVANFFIPIPKCKKQRIYLLIMPEEWELDTYLRNDIYDDMCNRFTKDSVNFELVLPNILKRKQFQQKLDEYKSLGKDFFSSKSWERIHRNINGTFYLIGKLHARHSSGSEKLIFHNLQIRVEYSEKDTNKWFFGSPRNVSGNSCIEDVHVDKNFEYEELSFLSRNYVNLIEFMLASINLRFGDDFQAYRLFKGIAITERPIINLALQERTKLLLEFTLSKIARDYLSTSKISEARELVQSFERDVYACATTRILLVRSSLMECSTKIQYIAMFPKLLEYLNSVNVEEKMRAEFLLNKSYIYYLAGDYNNAEKEVRAAAKYSLGENIIGLETYCDWVLGHKKDDYEKGVAMFTKARIKLKKGDDVDQTVTALHDVIEFYDNENNYFVEKTKEMMFRLNVPVKDR